jgi:sugar transferase (PEP-CTERM/EpsH1 system associated)
VEDLLFLAHRIPYPPDKGEKIRAWHFLRHLAERYRIHLACFIDDPADVEHVARLEEVCATVCWRRLFPSYAKLRSLGGVVSGAPLTRGYFADLGLRQAIRQIIVRHRPTRYFAYSSAMAPYLETLPPARSIIDMVDVDSEKFRHYAETASPLSQLIYAREARTLLSLERRVARLADRVLFVSRAEADLFRRLAPEVAARVDHVNNGVDSEYFDPSLPFDNPYAGERAIVFVGAMNYRPNVDAAVWFASEVMPMLRHSSGAVCFWIVGAHPAQEVRRLAAGDIRVTGRVADVRPYLAHAAAVVAPLRIARGIQNKVLEAMSMAAPVILTPQAREGLDPCADDELIEADGADAFAAAVGRALAGGAEGIGSRARARVRRDFSWRSSLAALDAQFEPGATQRPKSAAFVDALSGAERSAVGAR